MAYVPFSQLDDAALREIVNGGLNGAGVSGSQMNAAALELRSRAFKARFQITEVNDDDSTAHAPSSCQRAWLDARKASQKEVAQLLPLAAHAAKKAGLSGFEVFVGSFSKARTKAEREARDAATKARCDMIRKVLGTKAASVEATRALGDAIWVVTTP